MIGSRSIASLLAGERPQPLAGGIGGLGRGKRDRWRARSTYEFADCYFGSVIFNARGHPARRRRGSSCRQPA